MKRFDVVLTLTEPMLGTASANPDLVREFIASKRPEGVDEAEIESLPEIAAELQKATTVFHRDKDGKPALYDYTIKGFFKDACGSLRRADDTESKDLKAFKKEIDGLIFVTPRLIPIEMPDGGKIEFLERPLRAQTAQGERVALARSETVPVGTVIRFQLAVLNPKLVPLIEEWFEYGQLRGLGQWRNGGWGRFTCEMEEVKPKVVVA